MSNQVIRILFITCLVQQSIFAQPAVDREDVEQHLNNRLKHYLQRFDIIAKRFSPDFLGDLQNLRSQFESSLLSADVKDKAMLLQTYELTLNKDFSTYLLNELDKQYINEDILIHKWYVEQLLPHLDEKFTKEAYKFLDFVAQAMQTEDLDLKYDLFTGATDGLSTEFWDFINNDPEPVAVVNVHLQFFNDLLTFMLQSNTVGRFEQDLRSVLQQVEVAMQSQDYKEKSRVLDIFDDVSTPLGKFINEEIVGYEIYKYGE